MLEPAKTVLPNGVRVISVTQAESASASLRFLLKAGSAFETEEEQGISHFTEHLLFQGTERRPSFGAIGRAIESIGGSINGQTGHLVTSYYSHVLPAHLETAFDVLSDLLLHPRLDPNEVNRERQVVLEEINRRHDRPDEYVWSILQRLLWPGQAMGRETLGTPETLATFDRDKLASYLRHWYRSADLVVAAAGPLPHEEVIELANRYLGEMPLSDPHPLPEATLQPGRDVQVEPRPTAQTHLCLGFPAFGHLDPRITPYQVLITLLGRGISSRLFLSVRERLGLAYSVGAAAVDLVVTGGLVVRSGLRSDRLSDAIKTVIWELEHLKSQPATEEELARAKELEKAKILFGLERAEVVADHFGGQELLLGRMEPIENMVRRIDSTTVEELQVLARSLFRFDDLKVAAIGDLDRDVLARYLDQSLGT
ncbi:MAG: insulinase family protein [Chloroflexi bacterium]|nr:insulinase family protein [Chloroflexota bacterium]